MSRTPPPSDSAVIENAPGTTDDLPDETSEAEAAAEQERLEQQDLQRPDPAEDDLPDRAFDRITPGV